MLRSSSSWSLPPPATGLPSVLNRSRNSRSAMGCGQGPVTDMVSGAPLLEEPCMIIGLDRRENMSSLAPFNGSMIILSSGVSTFNIPVLTESKGSCRKVASMLMTKSGERDLRSQFMILYRRLKLG